MGIALQAAPVAASLMLAWTLVGSTGASYDAAAGALRAPGAAAADLRAPSAEVARVRAERLARAQAERRLSAALVELGMPPNLERLEKLLEHATVVDERFGSDGSVELTLQLSTKELPLKRPRKVR